MLTQFCLFVCSWYQWLTWPSFTANNSYTNWLWREIFDLFVALRIVQLFAPLKVFFNSIIMTIYEGKPFITENIYLRHVTPYRPSPHGAQLQVCTKEYILFVCTHIFFENIVVAVTARLHSIGLSIQWFWVQIIDIEVSRPAIVCPCLFRIMILCYSLRPKSGWKLGYV